MRPMTPPPVARHLARLSRRAPAAQQGLRYPPDPPAVEEIVAVMRQAGDGVHGARMRALIVLLWRAGLRINEALTVAEHDLEPPAGSVLVRYARAAAAARSAWNRGCPTRLVSTWRRWW
jgi:site-specific recombinase XerC